MHGSHSEHHPIRTTMSLNTWKKEYYPIRASKVTAEAAIAHSLQKWRGLRPQILADHRLRLNVRPSQPVVVDDDGGETLTINGESCALCAVYMRENEDECATCPLFALRNCSCDDVPDEDEVTACSPYDQFALSGDPEPMIELLEKALARQTEKQTKKNK